MLSYQFKGIKSFINNRKHRSSNIQLHPSCFYDVVQVTERGVAMCVHTYITDQVETHLNQEYATKFLHGTRDVKSPACKCLNIHVLMNEWTYEEFGSKTTNIVCFLSFPYVILKGNTDWLYYKQK